MSKYWGELRRYLFEVLAIITAITLSFLFDEWRQKRKDRRDSVELLQSIRENLVTDTTLLSAATTFHTKAISAELYILQHADSVMNPDSLRYGLLGFQTYPAFRGNDVAYVTMVQTGQSHVIENKDLLKQINSLYQTQYRAVNEWTDIGRKTVVDRHIPFMNAHTPYVPRFNYRSLVGNRQFDALLKKDEFRNMLQSDYGIKRIIVQLYDSVRKSADSLIVNINGELKKLD